MATAQHEELATYRMLIDGRWEDAASGRTFESVDPATGGAWASVPDAGADDVDRAVAAARAAFDGPWGELTPTDRGRLMFDVASVLEERAEALAAIETRDIGKLAGEARAQAAALPRWYRFFGGMADKIDGRVPAFDFATVLNYIVREPVGVVAALVPWNSPAMLATCKLAPALAAGNVVVVKPSDVASASVLELARAFEEAGFPPGVVNVITGAADAGQRLVGHPGVDHVTFTGGPATARAISHAAAEHLTPTSFELGGKSANIVFADADLDAAVVGVLAGIFAAAGQTCIAGSRALVHRTVHDVFLERLLARTAQIRLGQPAEPGTQVGPISSVRHLEHIERMVARARAEGATVAAGGERASAPGMPDGCFFAPTVLTGVTPAMHIAGEEVFGPVLSVMAFDTDDEAIALANDTRYSLAAGVWTRDVKRAHVVARRLKAGTVWVNMYRAMSALSPHGGSGLSGHGRENGIEAIAAFTTPKSVWIETSDEIRDPFVGRMK
jgi:(Z)-2-((N-methylformamido)methylene)-5-hydroxybutyrolactone dehydrogenase